MGNQKKISILRWEGVWPPLPPLRSFWENPHFRVILSHLLKNYLHCSLLMETWHYIINPPDSIQSHPRQSPDPSRHLPDTPQTPKIWALFVHIIPLGEKLAANKSNGMFMNCLHIIPPNHYPESLRQPPDTSQTPSKHPTDTPNLGKFWPSQGHWEKRKHLLRMSLMGCFV